MKGEEIADDVQGGDDGPGIEEQPLRYKSNTPLKPTSTIAAVAGDAATAAANATDRSNFRFIDSPPIFSEC